MIEKQSKTIFDSADYFMKKEKERRENDETDEVLIPDYPHAKTPVLQFRRVGGWFNQIVLIRILEPKKDV